jgi:uncharacterized membrane protein YkgB
MMFKAVMKFTREGFEMEEKVYKTVSGVGVLNIVLGVLTLVVGIAGGVLLLISGAKVINTKTKIII